MITWEDIRDEVAEMLADGKPLEDVIGKLEKRKNEMNKSKPMTNEEYLKSCTTEQLAKVLNKIFMTRTFCHICPEGGVCDIGYECKYHGGNTKDFVEWLKQPHTFK